MKVLVSRQLVRAPRGIQVRSDVPFSTHAAISVAFSRDCDDYTKWVPKQPKNLPTVTIDVQNNELSKQVWEKTCMRRG